MKSLNDLRERATELRKKGLSYNEILLDIPVAKSTISTWLKDMPLTSREKASLKSRLDANITRGRIKAASANRDRRLAREKVIFLEAKESFERFKENPLFFIGISLYWAEGAKRNSFFAFTNSDADMLRLMLVWMRLFLNVKDRGIRLRLYTHRPFAGEKQEEYWSNILDMPSDNFGKTVYKTSGLLVKKRPDYKGCMRIEVGKIAYLKKMQFWQQMLIEYFAE